MDDARIQALIDEIRKSARVARAYNTGVQRQRARYLRELARVLKALQQVPADVPAKQAAQQALYDVVKLGPDREESDV